MEKGSDQELVSNSGDIYWKTFQKNSENSIVLIFFFFLLKCVLLGVRLSTASLVNLWVNSTKLPLLCSAQPAIFISLLMWVELGLDDISVLSINSNFKF